MTSLEFTLTFLFVASGLLMTIGTKKLTRLSQSLFPDENFIGFRPPRRLLKRIEKEHKYDKDSLHKLKVGRTLEIVGLLTLILFLITFWFGLK